MSIKALQDYTFVSKYARYNKELQRRETWPEAIARVKEMHLKKFPEAAADIEWAFARVLDKKVLGSQRALQFGGPPIERHAARGYNCTSSFCDRLRFFQECFYLLLCGSGTGFSVQKHHVAKLPNFSVRNFIESKVYKIPDSIEGWADSLGVLLSSYMENPIFPEYANCDVIFDYSDIRPAGAPLNSCSGKAPGPDPLRRALERIKILLDRCLANDQVRLRPIDAYDIVMHASDAVLSGGVRRSATLSMFSFDDEEMCQAKTGNWFYENPQRARSNNSAILVRNKTSYEQFQSFMTNVRQYGEPGFIWTDSTESCYNPCFSASTRILTDSGYRTIGELYESGKENTVLIDTRAGKGDSLDLAATGIKKVQATQVFRTQRNAKVYDLETSHGHIVRVTSNHEFPTTRGRLKLCDMKVGDNLLLQSEKGAFGTDDGNYSTDFNHVPEQVWRGSEDFVRGYLHSLFQMHGVIDYNANEAELTGDKQFISDIQIVLANFGIVSETCDCKLVVTRQNLTKLLNVFANISNKNQINSYEYQTTVKSITFAGTEDVYCLTQPETNTVLANGVCAGQCVEINLYPIDEETGEVGWQACNLCEVNGGMIKSECDFAEAAKAAAIIGTLQAGYTDFPYLGEVTERIVKREALLGVSITGMMENPVVIMDEDIQQRMAQIVKDENVRIAKKIGIRPAARTTCVKPAGSTSCLLGTSSGIHPHHAKMYFRRVQANKTETPYQYFAKINPTAVEDSVWSANKTDGVITFCISVPDHARVKNDMSAVQLLECVKNTQQNWVSAGKRIEACVQPWLSHNVSNTVQVKPDEWDDVCDYIYNNRECFAGVSLLPASGDKDYQQAPMCTVFTPEEIVAMYGNGSLMASGLIVDGLHAFGGNLWTACDAVMGFGEYDDIMNYKKKDSSASSWYGDIENFKKKDWLRRAKQFADRYFDGDVRKMTYCLKDVSNWKSWLDLNREYKSVDYSEMLETTDNTKLTEEAACAGGACLI